MSKYNIHKRIAECLLWTEDEARTFPLATLRELVRMKDAALADEISLIIQQGLHLTDPIRDPRRVPMPDMSWLGPPPPVTDETKFQIIRNRAGVEVRRMHTKRVIDTVLSYCGKDLAWRTECLKRGKVVSTSYVFYSAEIG